MDYASRRWSDYTGIDTEEIQGWSWKHTVHPDDLRSALDRWTTAVDHPAPYENEYRLRRHDGQYRWFLVRAEPIFDQEGRPVCWFGTCTDIDDGNRRQEWTEECCSRIVAAAHDGACEIELDGTTRFVNPRMAEMLGYSVEEMLGRSVFDFLFEVDHAAAREELDRRSRRDNRTFDWRWRRRDGSELWTLASSSALTDAGGEVVGAVGLFADLTERRKSEQQLQASEERFRTSVENLLDCFGIFTAVRDAHGRIVDFRIDDINQAGCANNRLSADEQIGRGLSEILPAHRDNGLLDEYCAVVETGRPVSK